MIKILEDALFEKTKGSQSEILYAQWTYDKKSIPTALQAVSNLFPHYSLHDESHSITILNNIIRIIGKENIERLSAIDIWLLLEAAYGHDMGMIVPGDELSKVLNQSDFLDFFKEILSDNKNSLFSSANLFHIDNGQIKYKHDVFSLDVHDGIKFILAEFFRRSHANRSKKIIIDPAKEISLISPRGIIPNRIFKILAEICACHTKPFSDVINLPHSEVGIDTEDAHPRFIACLLRLGDLLDLDNNRFSEVFLRTLSKIPSDTLKHKDKHLSIEHFRIDRSLIEISAKCTNYDTANLTQYWFNFLNSEIKEQMVNWNNIVPNKDFGYLPTVGSLNVELLDYEHIDGKNKPKFSVDTDKALSLLQGAGLYDGPFQSIREILQNAVDATLIRIWLEHQDCDFNNPNSKDFERVVESYPIDVSINKLGVDSEYQNWKIIIRDRETGISKDDLKFLMKTGSSSKNTSKTNIVDTMPTWMKPSGTFGIGFQSIFLLADCINIETKSFFTEKYLFVELNNANSKKDGDILIKNKETNHVDKPGTTITIDYKTKAIPKGYTTTSKQNYARKISNSYDPFSHKSLDIEVGKIIDEVIDFAQKSYLPIQLYIDDVATPTKSNPHNRFDYFDENNSMELSISANDYERNDVRVQTYYKGQSVENTLRIDFINLSINIHRENAAQVLTLNRNKIKEDFNERINEQIFHSAFKVITENFDSIFDNDEKKITGSMFLNYYHDIEILKSFDITKYTQWQNFNIEVNNGEKNVSIHTLLTDVSSLKLITNNQTIDYDTSDWLTDTYNLTKDELAITIRGGNPAYYYTKFLLYIAKNYFSNVSHSKTTEANIKEVIFTKEHQDSPVSEEQLFDILLSHQNGNVGSARIMIPCVKEFFDLRVKDTSWKSYVFHYLLNSNIHLSYPKMLCPFISKGKKENALIYSINDELINWVYENRYNKDTTKEKIINTYARFKEKFSQFTENHPASSTTQNP